MEDLAEISFHHQACYYTFRTGCWVVANIWAMMDGKAHFWQDMATSAIGVSHPACGPPHMNCCHSILVVEAPWMKGNRWVAWGAVSVCLVVTGGRFETVRWSLSFLHSCFFYRDWWNEVTIGHSHEYIVKWYTCSMWKCFHGAQLAWILGRNLAQ